MPLRETMRTPGFQWRVERYRLFAYDCKRKCLWSGLIGHEPYRITEVVPINADDRLMVLNAFKRPETPLERL